jgi:hypothetical protein
VTSDLVPDAFGFGNNSEDFGRGNALHYFECLDSNLAADASIFLSAGSRESFQWPGVAGFVVVADVRMGFCCSSMSAVSRLVELASD